MTGAKQPTPPPTASGLHPKVTLGHETSVEQTERFLESEDFVPVEYKVELVHDLSTRKPGQLHNPCYNLEEALNKLGAVGWDLVYGNEKYMIFSRS